MSLTRHALIVALFTLPCVAVAQRGMDGSPGGRRDRAAEFEGLRNTRIPDFPRAKELEAFNAAQALLDDAGKLKLTDEQMARLKDLRATLYEHNAEVLGRYDAVRRAYDPPKANKNAAGDGARDPSAAPDFALLYMQIRQMAELGDALVANRAADTDACLQLVTEPQRAAAEKLLNKQTKKLRGQFPRIPRG